MAGELRANILTAVNTKGLDELNKKLGVLKSSFGALTSFAKGVGTAIGAIGAAGFAFGGQAVNEAKSLEQGLLSVKTVFGDLAPEMEKFAANAYNIGMSQSQAAKAVTFLGSNLKASGMEMGVVAERSQELVGLASDLAATYGYDVQEAMLGMTALFRGEYDPIEKFGVAIKQNEVNALLAARGQEKLTGETLKLATAQARYDLLMQATTDSQGQFARGTGNLFIEQAKLEAQFKNMQAEIGGNLIPVLADLAEKLSPILKDIMPALVSAFQIAGEIIAWLGKTIADIFDQTTKLGDSFSTLTATFNTLWQEIFGKGFDLQQIFDAATWAVDTFIQILTGLLRVVEAIVIEFKALGILIQAIFTGDWETVNKGLQGIKDELYDAADAAFELNKWLNEVRAKDSRGAYTVDMPWLTEASSYVARAKRVGEDVGNGLGDGISDGVAKSNPLKDFWDNLYNDVAKQSARIKLEALGASEGLIDAILGSGADWQKVFDSIVSGGVSAVAKAQDVFNRTASGIQEIADAAKKAQEELDKIRDAEIQRAKNAASANEETASYYDAYSRMLSAGYEKEIAMQVAREEYAQAVAERNAKLIAQQKELANSFTSASQEIFSAFKAAGITTQVGDYTQAVIELRGALVQLVQDNAFDGQTGLFSSSLQSQLTNSILDITDLMQVVANARDEIVTQIEDANKALTDATGKKQSLFQSIVDGIMGNVNVASIAGNANTIIKTLQRTLSQTQTFATQIEQLRASGLREDAIAQIISAGAVAGGATAKALMKGGDTAISEVNSLYTQINDAAVQIGSTTASAMYDSGIASMQSLVDGLMAQENEFVSTAEYLANAFKNAFDKAVTTGQVSINAPSYSAILDAIGTSNILGAGLASTPGVGYNYGSGANFTININPGVVTDPVGLGKEVVAAIQKYETNNGRVFVRA